jgi:hypothetical protein
MIIVTGTKRSGTSMWMQVLQAGGLQLVGEAFPKKWDQTIRDANPHGFYESPLRRGINFTTNPHPKTGAYLPPGLTRDVAVKVFIPGLVRSDLAYIHRVIASMRPWREYVRSLDRLYAMEHESLEKKSGRTRQAPVRVPPMLEWWHENHSLIRDVVVRQYKAHFVSYDAVLRDPEKVIREVFGWIAVGDADQALAAVKPETRTQKVQEHLPDEPPEAEVFDDLYALVDSGKPLTGSFIEKLNETAAALHEQVTAAQAAARKDAMQRRAARERAMKRAAAKGGPGKGKLAAP